MVECAQAVTAQACNHHRLDDDALPETMHCHRCRAPAASSAAAKAPRAQAHGANPPDAKLANAKMPSATALRAGGKVGKRPPSAAAGTRTAARKKRRAPTFYVIAPCSPVQPNIT